MSSISEIHRRKMKYVLTQLRKTSLEMNYFNLCLSKVLFYTKVMGLSCSTLGGFSAIRILLKNPLFAAIYAVVFADCIIGYVPMFSTSFQMTKVSQECKRMSLIQSIRFLRRTGIGGNEENEEIVREQRAIKMVIKSIPVLAIDCGGFRTVEREAVPEFCNFVINEISGLLVSFP